MLNVDSFSNSQPGLCYSIERKESHSSGKLSYNICEGVEVTVPLLVLCSALFPSYPRMAQGSVLS